ncbi:MAG: AAA family ATPase [Bacteroidetes bacterium]|nr:MAG: AAA family ATPase [Bacteroidota bacterium]TAG85743.1 MAG: AAA family ATPase [Bacteroidota bacterium]
MKKENILIPYGISNFENVITEGYIFVDKTNFLVDLETKERYVSFLRPRKMGKSLFVSILEYYYDVNKKDNFETIFSNLYIGKNPTNYANTFRILKFDFSGIDTRDTKNTEISFINMIKKFVRDFIKTYQLFDKETTDEILSKNNAGEIIGELFACYRNEKIKIYLIIDEYDHFTNEILIRNLTEFRTSVGQDGYVRKFYENIKIATQSGVINRLFITGVSPITLDSLTSGFNIITHLSQAKEFNDLIGFTQAQVEDLLDMVLEDKSRKSTILDILKRWYNGYKFNSQVKHTIYNSNMVLFFLKEFQKEQDFPKLMLDPNITPDYFKLEKIFRLINYETNIKVLNEILENGEVEDLQVLQFNYDKSFDTTYFINFLCYLGNLTIKQESEYGITLKFKIPNLVIEELYWQYYGHVLRERANFSEEHETKPLLKSKII